MKNPFSSMQRKELSDFIYQKKKELGKELTIFAHNFTADDIIPFADVVGDSLTLTNATMESKSRFVLFATAKFFTEVACVLVPDKNIMQANLQANCPLSYVVDEKTTRRAFDIIRRKCCKTDLIPMAYFTASSQLKSFCGEYKGTVCTASNATKMISHFLEQNKSIFFTSMNNIAFNAIKALNIGFDDVSIIDQDTDFDTVPGNKKIYVWDIGCYVHSDFRVSDIVEARKKHNDIKVIAHLECLPEVIDASDHACFTDGMHQLIRSANPGTFWAIATTTNFVTRLANTYLDKTIIPIRPDLICKDMVVTDLPHIAKSIQSIIDYKNGMGDLKYRIDVPTKYRKYAKKAIETMFEINRQMNILEEVVHF